MNNFFEKLKLKYPERKQENIIDILLAIQNENGFLSQEAINELSDFLQMPYSKVYSIASSYKGFRFKKQGKYNIQLCYGTQCHINKSSKLLHSFVRELKIEPGKSTNDGLFSLEVVQCLGACNHLPVFAVNGEISSKNSNKDIKELINNLKKQRKSK